VYEVHPDHAALAQALCRLAPEMDASVRVFFYEVGWPAPVNLLLDITADVQRKRQALQCFASQLALRDYVRHMEALNVYRTYTLPEQVRAAEGFLSVSAGELAADPMRCFGRSRLTERLLG
jgi:LmbE family N-acetylglucosaminyl deacetylase